MKLKNAKKLFEQATLDEMYVDYGHLVTDEEFRKKSRSVGYYQERAVERLFKEKINFVSNSNIIFNLMDKIASFKCPSCSEVMAKNGGGGCSLSVSIDYKCKCGMCFSISLLENGLGFKFPDQEVK